MEMEYHVTKFIHLLRQLGMRVSSAEAIESLTALSHLNILNRNHVKYALKATLVKDYNNERLFEIAFETYFSQLQQRQQMAQQWEQEQQDFADKMGQAEAELQFQEESLELSDEDKHLYSQLPENEKKKIQDFLDKSSKGKKVEKNFKPIVENLIRGSLEYWKRQIQEKTQHNPMQLTGEEDIDIYLNQISKQVQEQKKDITEQDMKDITDEDLAKVELIIKKLSRKLATQISRRYRMSNKIEKVDIRKSIRQNMKFGGSLIELKYKTKKVQKPKILLFCDVSGSMARYAVFVMQFIYGLASVIKDIESFVFAEQLERVTDYFSSADSFEATMAEVINKSNVWGEGTNISKALASLNQEYPKCLSSNTVVIIVSDGKTISAQSSVAHLKATKAKVKDILWLNTLPEKEWRQVSLIDEFKIHSKMYQCNTLSHLEKIITTSLA